MVGTTVNVLQISSFAIILPMKRERELIALKNSCSRVTVNILCFFPAVPWLGLWSVIVAFSVQTHLFISTVYKVRLCISYQFEERFLLQNMIYCDSVYVSLYILRGRCFQKLLLVRIFFLYKQKCPFCQGGGYLWLYCCRNNLYISHRSFNAPTYSFLSAQQRAYQSFLVTFWFGSVCITVARWLNFRENIYININYSYPTTVYESIFTQMHKFLVEK